MSYDDIIAKIKSDLTGNTDKDKAYLIKQFKIHNSKEIHLELGRLLWELMSDEEQNAYKKAVIQKSLKITWRFYHLNLWKILSLIIFTLIILWKRSYSENILKHQKS